MDAAAASTPTHAASQPPRGSFDDVYHANGSGLWSAASSSSLSLSAAGDKPQSLLLDDDAVMSGGDENDAMSETSSLGMDASDSDSAALAAIALDANDAMDLLLADHHGSDATEYSMARKPRPASFHGLSHSTSPSSPHSRPHQPPPHHAPLARASSLDETFSSSSSPFGSSPSTTLWGTGTSTTNNNYWTFSPKKRKRKIMLLHCRFASAMSKSVARDVSSPHPQLLEGQADDLMDGARSSSNSRHAQDENHVFAKVEWAHSESVQDDRHGVHLVAARNQVVGAQLRLLSNAPFQLTTDRTNWFLAQGHAPRARVHVETAYLPQAIHVEVLLIGCVEDESGDRVMETLEKRTSSPALAVEHAVYIRVRVGDVAIAGTYEIPVRVFTQHAGFTDEELSWTTSVTVRVASVTLPPPSQSHFHLDLWQHHSAVARAHGGVPLWSDAHFTLLDRYFASLAELGQKCVTVVATEMPWAGQQCYNETAYPSPLYEHAVLDVYEDDTGCGLQIDFQHFDRLVALAESHDMASEIEVFGLFSIWRDPANGFDSPVEATPSVASSSSSSAPPLTSAAPPVDLARKPSVSDDTKPLDSWRIRCVHRTTQRVRYLRSMTEIERFLSLFHAHCVERQLVDRVRVCADEPSDLPAFYQQMDFLERLAPRFRVKVALNNLAFLQHAPPQVVDFVPLLPLVCADLELTHRWRRHIHEVQHGRFCWYVCCGPGYPNQFVSSPLCETELVGFLTHFLGLDGFLRWNFCLWPSKPWESLAWRSPNWKVGDMYFVLPGLDGFPVETLRYEGMRFAVQSFALLRLAETRLPAPEFERLQADVASLVWRAPGHAQFGKYLESPGSAPEDLYSLDPEDYEQARRLLIDALALVESMEPASSVNTPPPVERDTLSPRRENNPPTSPRKRSFHGP